MNQLNHRSIRLQPLTSLAARQKRMDKTFKVDEYAIAFQEFLRDVIHYQGKITELQVRWQYETSFMVPQRRLELCNEQLAEIIDIEKQLSDHHEVTVDRLKRYPLTPMENQETQAQTPLIDFQPTTNALAKQLTELKYERMQQLAELIHDQVEALKANGKDEPKLTKTLVLEESPRRISSIITSETLSYALLKRVYAGKMTTMHLAAISNHAKLLKMAIDVSVDHSATDTLGYHAHTYAFYYPEILKQLLLLKTKDFSKLRTPYGEIIENLLKPDANPKLDNEERKSLEICRDYKQASVVFSKSFFSDIFYLHLKYNSELEDIERQIKKHKYSDARFKCLSAIKLINSLVQPYRQWVHTAFKTKTLIPELQLLSMADHDDEAIETIGERYSDSNTVSERQDINIKLNQFARFARRFIAFHQKVHAMQQSISTQFPSWQSTLDQDTHEAMENAIKTNCLPRVDYVLNGLTQEIAILKPTSPFREYLINSVTRMFLENDLQKAIGIFKEFGSIARLATADFNPQTHSELMPKFIDIKCYLSNESFKAKLNIWQKSLEKQLANPNEIEKCLDLDKQKPNSQIITAYDTLSTFKHKLNRTLSDRNDSINVKSNGNSKKEGKSKSLRRSSMTSIHY